MGTGKDLRRYCVHCPDPEYPRQAMQSGWEGRVAVQLQIDPSGVVTSAEIAESSRYPVLDRAALTVARQSRFHIDATSSDRNGSMAYRFRLTERR